MSTPPVVPELAANPATDTAAPLESSTTSSSEGSKEPLHDEPDALAAADTPVQAVATPEPVAVHEADAPVRAIAFPDEKEAGTHVHVGGTGAFPRVGTKELRRELTKDDKELANAGYEGLKGAKSEETKQVDIVCPRRVPLLHPG